MEDTMLREILQKQGIALEQHRLGLIMGLSPTSSREYYDKFCESIRERFGGNNCPEFAAENVNFGLTEALMNLDQWELVGRQVTAAAERLELSNVEAIAVLSNTIHRVFEDSEVAARIHRPVIHIGDCTAAEIRRRRLDRVGLLGTAFAMSEDFLCKHLKLSGAKIFTPAPKWWEQINRIIFDELCKDIMLNDSRHFLISAIDALVEQHDIQGVVLGCTELPLSLTREHQQVYSARYRAQHAGAEFHFFDAEELHIAALTDFCCDGKLPVIG